MTEVYAVTLIFPDRAKQSVLYKDWRTCFAGKIFSVVVMTVDTHFVKVETLLYQVDRCVIND